MERGVGGRERPSDRAGHARVRGGSSAGPEAGTPRKTYHTAVVVVPPPHAWEPIQAIRRIYDRKVERWMPHVTLLYPFRPREEFEEAARAIEGACAGIDPFRVTLAKLRRFDHGRGSFTMWLDPEPAAPWPALQAALAARFPDCDDVASHAGGFTPHLSVGQARGEDRVVALLRELQERWDPLSFEVDEVALIAREEEGPFRVERRVRLGAATGPSPRGRSTS
jgi:2'-5' RNA ligase